MSLLSNLLGGKKVEKAAEDLVKGLFGGKKEVSQQSAPSAQTSAPAPVSAPEEEGPSGFSWGPKMPDEENQFNFAGSYTEYFDKVFSEEFPEYDIEKEYGDQVVFTFIKDGSAKLVVELLHQSSGAYKRRRDCAKNGIKYLRYYVDHDGWWNTRRYVTERTRSALGG